MNVRTVISGGQTGVEQGALDAAMWLGIPHGGWCPLGRRCEDGRIPDKYELDESDSPEYRHRALANVRDSRGTLVVTRSELTPGSRLTVKDAEVLGRPVLHVQLATWRAALLLAPQIRAWINAHDIDVLNVAGTRESRAPGVQADTARLLVLVL